ncbi:hypothetical protein [Thioalkalivibrio sp. ALJ3]|uniref:hypothetical protein n=1 Tax=Thioalkalivibrio sp. ALJ3 TaxID=1240557 RepID=UPI001E51CB19|nr:hypothetical protein [Thioalkalivibrio sp. ALJ3]
MLTLHALRTNTKERTMQNTSPKRSLALLGSVFLAVGLGAPVAAGDIEAEKDEILAEMENVAEQMAMQRDQSPAGAGQDVTAEYQQMKEHAARQLSVEFGASDSQLRSFREQARAIGYEHGVME